MMAKAWFHAAEDAQTGPVDADEIYRLIRNGNIKPDTLVWSEGMRDWEPAKAHFETSRRFAPPSMPRNNPAPAPPRTPATGGLYAGAPARGFVEAIGICLGRYFGFSGRASRSEYWYFILFGVLTGIVLGIVDLMVFDRNGIFTPLTSVLALALFFPNLAVGFRRMHDTGRTGLWVLLVYLSPFGAALMAAFLFALAVGPGALVLFYAVIVGWFISLVLVLVFLCTKGDPGRNAYG